MKPVSISNSSHTSDQAMSHDHQNKRRQQDRWRPQRNQNLFSREQHTYPTFPNQNQFLWRNESMFHQIIKPITVVAGSSMASHLIERNLQTSKDIVKLTFERGCNCAKMLSWLRSVDGHHFMRDARRLILILGTNDLHVVRAEETVHRIRGTVESIRLLFPGIQIVWQLLQWRMKATRYLSSGTNVLQEIHQCNIMLQELARRLNFQIIDPALTRQHICHDNLHPTSNGSRLIESCIRSFLEQQ